MSVITYGTGKLVTDASVDVSVELVKDNKDSRTNVRVQTVRLNTTITTYVSLRKTDIGLHTLTLSEDVDIHTGSDGGSWSTFLDGRFVIVAWDRVKIVGNDKLFKLISTDKNEGVEPS